MSQLVLQKYFEVLNSAEFSISKVFIAPSGVGVKSLATCPASQPVAMSAVLAAGTRLSILSEIEVETFWSLIEIDLLVCFTLPNTSFCAHSRVSLLRAAPMKIFPQVDNIFCIPTLP